MRNSSRINQEPIKKISASKRKIKEPKQSKPERKRVSKTVREDVEYYQAIIRNSSGIIVVLDKRGIISYVSPSVEDFLGYGPDELIGTRVLDLIVPDDKPRAVTDFGGALLVKENLLPNSFHVKHKNGTVRILEGVGSNLLDDPLVAGFVINLCDITERKHDEDALHESEMRYRTLFDGAQDGMALAEIETGRLVDCNQSLCRMVGRTKKELIGKNQTILHPPETIIGKISRTFKQHIEKDPDITLEEKLLSKRGTVVPVEIRGAKIRLSDKDFLLGIFRDISHRKKAEAEIEESEERFRVIFERSAIGKSLTKPDGSLLQVNRAFADMLGYSIEELHRLNFAHITHPDDVAESRECIRSLVAGEQTDCRFEKRYLHKNGDTVWADVSTTLQRNAQGIPLYLITSIVDITERKRVEEDLRESELLFRKVFQDHTAVKMIMDPDTGDILDVNRAAVEFYGWSRVQLTQMKIQEINTLSPEEIKKEMEEARSNKKVHFEFRHRRADGSVRDVGVFSSKIEVNNKALLHSIIFDISARKQAENDLLDTLERLRNAVSTNIQVIKSIVEARDPYTASHQLRVADLARTIATEMELSPDMIEGLWMASSIHDLGKLSIPTEILSKPGKLAETEFVMIKEHSEKGFEILKNIESPWPLAEIVYQHHERMDGSGYPRNLKGDEILMEARILAVCDVVEAMASHRPYRAALGVDAALKEIEDNRGILYDADVVDICIKLFREKGFTFEKT